MTPSLRDISLFYEPHQYNLIANRDTKNEMRTLSVNID